MSNPLRSITRDQLAAFLPNSRAVLAFEKLLNDVNFSLPDAVEAADSKAQSALSLAAQVLAQLIADVQELKLGADFAPRPQQTADAYWLAFDPQLTPDPYAPQQASQAADDAFVPPSQPVGTLGLQNANNVAIAGGALDGITIGATTPGTGVFTTLAATGWSTLWKTNIKVDFGELRFNAANGANANAWRLVSNINGVATDGTLVIQHTTDNFVANFTNALTLNTDGTVTTAGTYKVGGTQVVQGRIAGYVAMTGTSNKNTAYDPSTITLVQLAQRVKALQDDLMTHGLIGT